MTTVRRVEMPVKTSRGDIGRQIQNMLDVQLQQPEQLHELQAQIKMLHDRSSKIRDKMYGRREDIRNLSPVAHQRLRRIISDVTNSPNLEEEELITTSAQGDLLSQVARLNSELASSNIHVANLQEHIKKLEDELDQRSQQSSNDRISKKRRLDLAMYHLNENHEQHLQTIQMLGQIELNNAQTRSQLRLTIAERNYVEQRLERLQVDTE